MITVSVPGKIHLLGEHAAVYGHAALLAAVNLRMRVTAEVSKRQSVKASRETIQIISTEQSEYARHAVEKVFEYFHITHPDPITISITSDIPPGYHLGSSAATAVGVVAATGYFLNNHWDPTLYNEIAYDVEKKQHGNPSGGDNTAVTYGGLVWYRKEMEFLKTFQHLSFSIPESFNHFYLVDTGRPAETTGEMVSLVKNRITYHVSRITKLMSENETQVKRMAMALKENDEKTFIAAMQKGERTLESIGVVSKYVIPLIRDMEKNGGAAKILGGGGVKQGVGFLLCYQRDKQKVDEIAKKYKFPYQKVQLGAEGVRLEV